jgi:tetratricopeptide (TPR) repeat protein
LPVVPAIPYLNHSGHSVTVRSDRAIDNFNAMVQRGWELLQFGSPDELRDHAEKLLRSAEALGPEQKSIGLAWVGLAYAEQGRSAEAERALTNCLNLRELLWSDSNQSNPDHAMILTALGGLYVDLRQYDKAEKRLDEAGRIWRSRPGGSQDSDVAVYANNSGMLWYGRGQYSKAEPYLREAVVLLERFAADDDNRLAQARAHLAAALSRLNLHVEADALSAQALTKFKHKLEKQPFIGSELLAVRLLVLRRAKRRHEAKVLEEFARVFQSRIGTRHVVDISALARSR